MSKNFSHRTCSLRVYRRRRMWKNVKLMNLGTVHQHQPCFKALSLSAAAGCPLRVLIATTVAENQLCNNNDMIYRSSRREEKSAVIDQLSTDFSAAIYLYKSKGSERHETAGIFWDCCCSNLWITHQLPLVRIYSRMHSSGEFSKNGQTMAINQPYTQA